MRDPTALQLLPASAGFAQPVVGSALSQLVGLSDLRGEVERVFGVFNPRLIGHSIMRLMRQDPVVAFGSAILRAPVVNLRWTIESEDVEVAAFVEAALRPIYRRLSQGASQAVQYGYQALEKIWQAGPLVVEVEDKIAGTKDSKEYPTAWTIRQTKAMDHLKVTVLINRASDEWGGLEQTAQLGVKTTRIGTERAILWSFRKEDVFGRLEGDPIFKQVYEPWWWKSAGNLFTNRYFERKADPVPVGRAHPEVRTANGQKRDGFQYLAEQLLALKAAGVMVLPSARDDRGNPLFSIEYLQDDKRGDMFQSRLDALDVQILRGLFTTDKAATNSAGQFGSFAMASQHAEVLSELLGTVVNECVEEVLQPQVIDPIVLYNFGEERLRQSRTRIKAAGISRGMKDLLQTILVELMKHEATAAAGKKQVKLVDRLDGPAIAEELDLPLRSADELESLEPEPAGGVPRPNGT